MAEMAESASPAGAVSIGNYKGVMLCNRPFNGVSSTLAKEARPPAVNSAATANSATKMAFLAGMPPEPLGMNVPILTESMHAIKRDKKNTALSKHKKWLHDLQKERARLQAALQEDEEQKQQRHERFSNREAKFRQAVRRKTGTDPEDQADSDDDAMPDAKRALSRPMWALTKETADEKLESLEDARADELIAFANNLDLDQFMDDVEIRARVAQVEEQLQQLQSIVDYEEAEETRADRDAQRELEGPAVPLNANDLARLGGRGADADDDDDARSVASTVLSECKSIRSVHSMRSVAVLTKRAEAKLGNGSNGEAALPPPRVTVIDEEQGARLQIKTLPSNLPYIHRNPAV